MFLIKVNPICVCVCSIVHLQGLVNVLIEHHPNIGEISSPTDTCCSDVQNPKAMGHLPNPDLPSGNLT